MSFSEIWQTIVRGFKSLFGMSTDTSESASGSKSDGWGVEPPTNAEIAKMKSVRYPSSPASVTLRKTTYSSPNPVGYGFEDIYNPSNPFAWSNPASPYYRAGYLYSSEDHPYGEEYPGGLIGSTWNDRLSDQDAPAPVNGAAAGNDEIASTPGVVDTSNIGGGSYADDTKPTETDSLTGQPFEAAAPAATGGDLTASKNDLDSASDLAGGGWGPDVTPAPSYSSPSSDSGSSYSSSSSSSYDSGSSSSSSSSSSDSGGGW